MQRIGKKAMEKRERQGREWEGNGELVGQWKEGEGNGEKGRAMERRKSNGKKGGQGKGGRANEITVLEVAM